MISVANSAPAIGVEGRSYAACGAAGRQGAHALIRKVQPLAYARTDSRSDLNDGTSRFRRTAAAHGERGRYDSRIRHPRTNAPAADGYGLHHIGHTAARTSGAQ